jgi:hypothetical protein
MVVLLAPEDLAPFATIPDDQAQAMVDDAIAMAVMAAPCLADDDIDPAKAAAAKAILRGAVLRWNDTGSGAFQSQQAGPFSMTTDTRQPRRAMFWPSEITALQGICKGDSKAFTVDTAPGCHGVWHSETCNVVWGAPCSCGADIAGFPLYGVP